MARWSPTKLLLLLLACLVVNLVQAQFQAQAVDCCSDSAVQWSIDKGAFTGTARANCTCTLKIDLAKARNQNWDFIMGRLELYVSVPETTDHTTPIIVSAHQQLSNTNVILPYSFQDDKPVSKRETWYFSSNRTLCLAKHKKAVKGDNPNMLIVTIDTSSASGVQFKLLFKLSSSLLLELGESSLVSVSPMATTWFRHDFGPAESPDVVEVVMTSEGEGRSICTLVAADDPYCPVYDLEETITKVNEYKTMTEQAVLRLSRKHYPDGVMIIIIPLSSDKLCVSPATSAEVDQNRIPNRNPNRLKTITLIIQDAEDHNIWIMLGIQFSIFFLSLFVAIVLIFYPFHRCALRPAIDYIKGNPVPLDARVVDKEQQTEEIKGVDGSRNSNLDPASDQETGPRPDSIESGERSVPPNLPTNNDEPKTETRPLSMTYADVLATTTKTKLDDVTRHRNRFCKPTFFISAFFAIPVWQFIYYIWASMTDSGNHDICYYNELCRAKMHVSDFNHLLSNLLYAFFGIAFMIIVYCRKRSFLGSGQYVVCGRGLLIPWGAYFAMGLSLVMEGVLSGAYHLCPSRSTFQFDVAFMYVIAVLLLSTMHQIRFRAIPSGTKPFILLTILTLVSLVFTLIEHWGSESHAYYARIIFCICHIVFAVFYCLGLFYHGTLKIVKKEETATDPNRSNETQTQAQMIPNQEEEWYTGFYWAFYHLWFPLSRTWIYRKVFRNQGSHVPKTLKIAHNPQTGLDKPFWVWRFIWCLVLFLVNAIMSILLTRNAARFSNYLLFILLTNVGASLLIYVFWKFFYWNRERKSQEEQDPDKPANWPFTVQTCLYFLVAAVTGVYAFIKFRSNVTEWSKTAAESRVLNKPCLELWKHYDQHDVWHFFSAVALFFSFLGQLTLDDGLIMKERNKIHVF